MNGIYVSALNKVMIYGFEGFYDSLVQAFGQNPLSYQNFINRTCRATLPLLCHDEAMYYAVAYGISHFKTFGDVLASYITPNNIHTYENVIDYGCGQGIATAAYIDYLAKNRRHDSIGLNVYLIEPSAISLTIAKKLVRNMADFHGVMINVHAICGELDKVILPVASHAYRTVHLFNNVLDVPTVRASLPRLSRQMQSIDGEHVVLACSPDYSDAMKGFRTLSHKLGVPDVDIYQYSIAHQEYRVIQQQWRMSNSVRIGMGFEFCIGEPYDFYHGFDKCS
ncbi:MAG: hypothetical protein Q4G13_02085 [Moraxella sp.]|nr:hypothetical protein [Moraxella sp.]